MFRCDNITDNITNITSTDNRDTSDSFRKSIDLTSENRVHDVVLWKAAEAQ